MKTPLLLLAIALSGAVSYLPATHAREKPAAATPSPQRPKKIFAHFMGCWPIASGPTVYDYEAAKTLRHDSPDERQKIGGHIRNWGLITPDTKLSLHDSCDLEIRRALRIGIDGFTIDAWAGGQSAKDTLDMLFTVAEEKNYPFEITITPDPNALGKESDVDAIKYLLDKHGKSPKLARRDGKPLLFGYQSIFIAMRHPGQVYKDKPDDPKIKGKWVWGEPFMRLTPEGFNYMGKAMKEVETAVGQPLYMEFCMSAIDFGINGATMTADQKEQAAGILAKYVGGVGSFNWLGPNQEQIGKTVVQNGAEWMFPIGPGQKENIPYESYGPPGLDWFRSGWDQLIQQNSTLLQYITWNDYGENSNLAPGYNTRYALYDLTGYYIAWWKTGKPPVPTQDKVYIVYHKYPKGAKIFPFAEKFPRSDAPAIEVVTILPRPATVRLPGRNVEYQAPAGLSWKQFPNTPGPVTAELIRNGKVTLALQSPEPITDKPFREDNGYVAWSSEEARNWKADFGDKPMWSYSEYGDVNNNGLPNWFEMYWSGKWMDFSAQTGMDPAADPKHTGKSSLQHYQEQTDPTVATKVAAAKP